MEHNSIILSAPYLLCARQSGNISFFRALVHEIISMVICSLPLIQTGQLSVTAGESMGPGIVWIS